MVRWSFSKTTAKDRAKSARIKPPKSKVDSHMGKEELRAARGTATQHDYVHERAPAAVPDTKHGAKSKVDSHMGKEELRAARGTTTQHDYVHERAPEAVPDIKQHYVVDDRAIDYEAKGAWGMPKNNMSRGHAAADTEASDGEETDDEWEDEHETEHKHKHEHERMHGGHRAKSGRSKKAKHGLCRCKQGCVCAAQSGIGRSASHKGETGSGDSPKKGDRLAHNEAIYTYQQADMDRFLKMSHETLTASIKRAMNPNKKGWELNFDSSVLTELTELSQFAARSAASAAMTACAAADRTVASMRRVIKKEPLLEAYHETHHVERTPSPIDNTPRWGNTKSHGDKIIKPLGFLTAEDPTVKKKKKKEDYSSKARTAHRRLRDDELPDVLKDHGEQAFDATSYAAKKANRIQAARAKRGSNIAVALPAIHKNKKGGKKGVGNGNGGGVNRASEGSEMAFPSGVGVED